MDDQVKEKLEVPKRKRGSGVSKTVTFTLTNVPRSIHSHLQKYRRRINSERQKDYNMKEAYVEFLKEATKTVK